MGHVWSNNIVYVCIYIYYYIHQLWLWMKNSENLQTQWLQPPRFRWLHPAGVPHSRQRRCQTETWRQLSVRENSCTSLAFMGVPQRSFLSLNLICCLSYQRLKLDWMESRFWTNRHLVDWKGNVQDHLDVLELQHTFANLAYSKSLDWLLHLSRWFLFRKAWTDEDSHNTDRCTCNRWLTPTDGTLLITII